MWKKGATLVLLSLLSQLWVVSAYGQADRKKANPYGGSPLEWGIDPIIELNVRHMTRHYNLTSEQEDYTRQLMTLRVKRFLKDYEQDVRGMWNEYWYYQKNREVPSAEVAKDWAARGRPLVSAIRKEIFDGNMQWRRILNDEQRKKHDKDLKVMGEQFDKFDQRMERWRKGQVDPADVGKVSGSVFKITNFEDAWEFRVRSFIQEYNLDEGQRQTAYSILRELREEAASYREQRKQEFADIEASYGELTGADPQADEADREKARQKRQQLDKRRTKLEHHLKVVLWKQLMDRLKQIPTAAQLQARKGHEGRLGDMAGVKKTAGGTTKPAGTTQPASGGKTPTTQPAAAPTP